MKMRRFWLFVYPKEVDTNEFAGIQSFLSSFHTKHEAIASRKVERDSYHIVDTVTGEYWYDYDLETPHTLINMY
jgi:hypothetical protein